MNGHVEARVVARLSVLLVQKPSHDAVVSVAVAAVVVSRKKALYAVKMQDRRPDEKKESPIGESVVTRERRRSSFDRSPLGQSMFSVVTI